MPAFYLQQDIFKTNSWYVDLILLCNYILLPTSGLTIPKVQICIWKQHSTIWSVFYLFFLIYPFFFRTMLSPCQQWWSYKHCYLRKCIYVGLSAAQSDHTAFVLEQTCILRIQWMDKIRLSLFRDDHMLLSLCLKRNYQKAYCEF